MSVWDLGGYHAVPRIERLVGGILDRGLPRKGGGVQVRRSTLTGVSQPAGVDRLP